MSLITNKRVLITGGSGFIGSALIRSLSKEKSNMILNVDKLTYASMAQSTMQVSNLANYNFIRSDICDIDSMKEIISSFRPNIIFNFAAESHVDNSITGPLEFINTNVVGTANMLIATQHFLERVNDNYNFLFHHISTDEVFGALGPTGYFRESNKYDPSSPYSASKASSDHLVRSWSKTYGIPYIITNTSNNYGPFQHPEKLIPKSILCALNEKPIPIYGKGLNIRDWLFVEDHISAIELIASSGHVNTSFNIGGGEELSNIDLINLICAILKDITKSKNEYTNLISFVGDRPGHDFRYAIDSSKLKMSLGWKPKYNLEDGIHKTINWVLKNFDWFNGLLSE